MTDAIYLGPDRSGIPWLLDPAAPRLAAIAREFRERTPETWCEPEAVAADLALLPGLLRERHFGVATGVTAADGLDELIADARERVLATRPGCWGDALGDLSDQLRQALRDRHVRLGGSHPSRIRAGEPVFPVDSDAPAVEVRELHGVLCVTIRRLSGSSADDAALWAFAEQSAEHFAYDRIIVDLRGNGGGNDAITYQWIEQSLPAGVVWPATASGWFVGESPVGFWNWSAYLEARDGLDAVPRFHREHRHQPRPDDVLEVRAEDDDAQPAGSRPWHGAMLVLVDGDTCSSGESSMWMLRHGLGARVAGRRTAGMLEFGNVVPYFLPNAGLHVQLATKRNVYAEAVELVGFPVDVEIDPTTPLAVVAERFDRLHGGVGTRP
ncbi:MAG: hypothetical protein HOU81_03280 [Hamadaea sp.]|uniref:S41 family peptidase n=1 Tax=Hamadaea sp. TaxID=2024425 RepID=UPI001828A171|nr:S41 family peptidase [Hamadaea sp.]NUR69818.1 hypothetical protein [Hamadaea sp.]NUT19202.1 hypothetical protein [Hamadaea sp.]